MSATLPSGKVCGHLSGVLLDPLLVQEGLKRERENMRTFGVYERVPRHQAVGKKVRVQSLNDCKRNLDRSVFVRDRLFAMQTAGISKTTIIESQPMGRASSTRENTFVWQIVDEGPNMGAKNQCNQYFYLAFQQERGQNVQTTYKSYVCD